MANTTMTISVNELNPALTRVSRKREVYPREAIALLTHKLTDWGNHLTLTQAEKVQQAIIHLTIKN